MQLTMRPIAFYPELAIELGDIEAAIYYQQIHFWADKGKRDDGFIWKSKADIEKETTLTRKQQDRVRKVLVAKGWLQVEKLMANGHPTLHFKPLVDLELSISTKGTQASAPKGPIHTPQRDQSITETTTETTTENTTDVMPPPAEDVDNRQPTVTPTTAMSDVRPTASTKRPSPAAEVVGYFFTAKGWSKENLPERTFGSFIRAAKDLVDTTGSVEKAKAKIDDMKKWADERELPWSIETIFKQWVALETPESIPARKKKAYIGGDRAYQDAQGSWHVILQNGEHKNYIGSLKDLTYR